MTARTAWSGNACIVSGKTGIYSGYPTHTIATRLLLIHPICFREPRILGRLSRKGRTVMTITAIRTVIIYIFLIAAMRIMGKRQLGELQPVELVVTLLISDLAAVPMQESGMPLLVGLVPIFVLVAMELLLSGLMLKIPWVSRMISGNPIVIVNNGKLDQKALKRLRLTLDDLMEALRQLNYFDLRDIQYAVAETNGKISVFPMPAKQPVTCGDVDRVPQDTGMPVVIISDGKISQWAMELLGLTEEWVREILIRNSVAEEDVFLMTVDKSRQYFILRCDEAKAQAAGA